MEIETPCQLVYVMVTCHSDNNILLKDKPELPTFEVIAESQKKYPPTNEDEYTRSADHQKLWVDKQGRIYIPSEDEELQLRIAVSAHCGLGGHRGYTTTCKLIKDKMYWKNMEEDIKAFVQGCFVCLVSSSGDKVRRPLGTQLHA